MSSRFIQIHTLTNYPASLLNRDDAGFAKRMPFGGAVRTRISSQCLKRHWRVFDGQHSLRSIAAPESVRSRVSFDEYIVKPLIAEGKPADVVRAATQKLVGKLLGSELKEQKAEKRGKKKTEQAAAAEPDARVMTSQVTVLGKPELDYLCRLVADTIDAAGPDASPGQVDKEIDKRTNERDLKENLKALRPGSLEAGLGAALFGRMVTGDILARTDAAIHVAHAMTVHAQMAETDYFTAIDDLERDAGGQGSGHINATELTSGLYYGYVVADVNGLVSNLGGDRPLAGDVLERLVHMVSTVTPGAKKGSTAPYAYSHLVLVEAGNAQPRTLQNAFVEPVRSTGNVIQNAYGVLNSHLADLDGMYGKSEQRAHAGLATGELFEARMPLADLAGWARMRVLE